MFSNHWHHHSRFYVALVLAVLAYVGSAYLKFPVPAGIGGDVFFISYLGGSLFLAMNTSKSDLDKRADVEDEGMIVVFLLTLAAIVFACISVFEAINQKGDQQAASIAITLAGAPLGWFMLHTVMAFHYANIFYKGSKADRKKEQALQFPGNEDPGVLDFLYYSFVVGMTAQVSDVQVQTTAMRRATLIHSIVSFFFNTVLIAMAVNAVVAKAG